MNLQDKYIELLQAQGFRPAVARSRKYVIMAKSGEKNIYLGKKGSIRRGDTYTGSIPILVQSLASKAKAAA